MSIIKRPKGFTIRKFDCGFPVFTPSIAFVHPTVGLAGPRVSFASNVKLWKYLVMSAVLSVIYRLTALLHKLDENTFTYTAYWWVHQAAVKISRWGGGYYNLSRDIMIPGDALNSIRGDMSHFWRPHLHVLDGWEREANGDWIPRTYTRFSNGFIEAVHCPKCNWHHVWKQPASAMEYTRIREGHLKLCQPESGRPPINFPQGDGVPETEERFKTWRPDDGSELWGYWANKTWQTGGSDGVFDFDMVQ